MFKSLEQISAVMTNLPAPDQKAAEQARLRQSQLVKPDGSLGRLEEIAIHLATWQSREKPALDKTRIIVFAGAHGVTKHGVSAYPAEVNAQMLAGFHAGFAAICQLAKAFDAELSAIDCGIDQPTSDFSAQPAMTEAEFLTAFQTGYDAVRGDEDLLIFGEMGIGNSTSAAALYAAMTDSTGDIWVGRGTGVNEDGLKRKADLIDTAIALHGTASLSPMEILRHLGGREIAALTGGLLAARKQGIPVLLDGYIVTAAAMVLYRAGGQAMLENTIAAHCSDEQAHFEALNEIGLHPLLFLDMRLGEASGAAAALGLVKAAVACHNGMATFAEAAVPGPSDAT